MGNIKYLKEIQVCYFYSSALISQSSNKLPFLKNKAQQVMTCP